MLKFWHFVMHPECQECKNIKKLKEHVLLEYFCDFMSNDNECWCSMLENNLVFIYLIFISVFCIF